MADSGSQKCGDGWVDGYRGSSIPPPPACLAVDTHLSALGRVWDGTGTALGRVKSQKSPVKCGLGRVGRVKRRVYPLLRLFLFPSPGVPVLAGRHRWRQVRDCRRSHLDLSRPMSRHLELCRPFLSGGEIRSHFTLHVSRFWSPTVTIGNHW